MAGSKLNELVRRWFALGGDGRSFCFPQGSYIKNLLYPEREIRMWQMLHPENNGWYHFLSEIRLYQTSARLQRPTQHKKFHFTSLQSPKLLQRTIGIQFDLGLLSLHKRGRVIPCLQVLILLRLHPARLGCKQVCMLMVLWDSALHISHLKRKPWLQSTLWTWWAGTCKALTGNNQSFEISWDHVGSLSSAFWNVLDIYVPDSGLLVS